MSDQDNTIKVGIPQIADVSNGFLLHPIMDFKDKDSIWRFQEYKIWLMRQKNKETNKYVRRN